MIDARDLNEQLARPRRIIRLSLERNAHDDDRMSLILVLRDERGHVDEEIRFHGVMQLKFRGEETDLSQLVVLAIEDIGHLGWESVRYRVRDTEEEVVTFLCGNIDKSMTT